MADIRRVTDDFAVAPQLTEDEVGEAAGLGFRLLVNNRPDYEVPSQPTGAAMAAAAKAAGMAYVHVPVSGGATPDQVRAMYEAVKGADGPVLAFCRSGTRSITTWARGQAGAGARSRDDLVALGHDAGYDLSAAI